MPIQAVISIHKLNNNNSKINANQEDTNYPSASKETTLKLGERRN